jgi:hypothetical protein
MPWTIAFLPTQTTLDVGTTGCQSTRLGLGGRAPPDQAPAARPATPLRALPVSAWQAVDGE